jgi:hypothetical protein
VPADGVPALPAAEEAAASGDSVAPDEHPIHVSAIETSSQDRCIVFLPLLGVRSRFTRGLCSVLVFTEVSIEPRWERSCSNSTIPQPLRSFGGDGTCSEPDRSGAAACI